MKEIIQIMGMTNRYFLSIFCCFLTWAAFGQKNKSDDFRLRTDVTVKHDLSKKWNISGQFQTRWYDNLNDFKGFYYTLGCAYEPIPNLTIKPEVRLFTSTSIDYLRWGLFADYKHKIAKNSLSLRLGYTEELDGVVWGDFDLESNQIMGRGKLEYQHRLTKKLFGIVSSELYFDLSDGMELSRIRNFLGAEYKFSKKIAAEILWMYQPMFKKSTHTHNIFAIQAGLTFKI